MTLISENICISVAEIYSSGNTPQRQVSVTKWALMSLRLLALIETLAALKPLQQPELSGHRCRPSRLPKPPAGASLPRL